LTVQNFVNDDDIIVYNSKFTKLGAAAASSRIDSHNMHNGVTFQAGNTPAAVTTATFTMVDAHGANPDVVAITTGALSMTSVDIGAIDTFILTSGGGLYESPPPVSVANSYTPSLGNALDVMGAPNALLNVNLHSFTSGTIAQDGNVVTLDSDETFPDANSGVLTLTYANGTTDQVTAITNSSVIRVANEKIFGLGTGDLPDKQTYSLSYMAIANNITKNTLLYNDDYSTRGRVLDFIDKKTVSSANPVIANGNTTLRVDMTTTQDFGSVIEAILLEERNFHNDSYSHEKLLLESATVGSAQGGGGIFLTEDCVEFLVMEDDDLLVAEADETRFYTEQTTGERVTAHTNVVSTYTTGTMAQSGLVVTGVNTIFPNDFVRGTITYYDDSTSTITGYTNATSFTVEDSKTVGAGNTYSISYNSALTWGTNRIITVLAGSTGNRTVVVTETGHYLRSGDKVKISGSSTTLFNGVYPITVTSTNTYNYTLPEDTAVTSPSGALRAMPVSSVWLATSNAVTMDTSLRGNNAVIEVSAIAIGAIQTAEIYNFGAGYSSIPTLSTTSGDQNAELTAGLGAFATYPGYYSDTKGLLSGVPKIQDNKYYQNFSYVLKTDFDVNDYRSSVKRLIHPSGMIMFGELSIRSKISVEMYDANSNDPDDLGTIAQPGIDNSGRKYHTITITQNASSMNVQFQTFGSNNELEIYTANHPWQAMDARLEVRDDVNLQLENYVEISSIARTNSTMYVVTETLHGLETGDTIIFSGDESSQQYQNEYAITSVPTTNTYTITPAVDHPNSFYDGHLYIQLEDQTTGNGLLMEDNNDLLMEPTNYIKSEVKAYANVFRAIATNWDSPFSGSLINEDGTEILLESGGSYLYPKIQFPIAESGSASIDMSFNSDILLEDDDGYLLDEASGGMGNGPARYISLEEDTTGPNSQYESIPIVDTVVHSIDHQTTGWLILQEDESGGILYEDDLQPALHERILTEYSHVTTSDQGRFKRIVPTIEYIDYFSSTLGRIKTEDGDLIINEVITSSPDDGISYIREENDYNGKIVPTIYMHPVESMGWHLKAEDDSHIANEDGTRPILETDSFQRGTRKITQLGSTQPATVLTLSPSSSGGSAMGDEFISDHPNRSTGSSFGMQVFRPHYTSQWKSPLTDISFTHDRMTLEGEVGLLLAEDDLLVTDHMLFEDGGAAGEDLLNSGEAYSEFFQLEDQGVGNNILNEDNTQFILMETSRQLESEYRIHQSWIVIPTYKHSRILTRLQGQIAIPHNSVTVTGTNTTFTTQVKVGETFQTTDENIILEDTTTMLMEDGDNITYEDDDLMDQEHVESDTDDLQLEDGGKVLLTEPGEFKVKTITNDTTLVVTRKHWGGTDAVFWRQ
jgi:hypothetical protein